MPRIEDSARYNGITYYVTRNHPIFDYWHSYSELTKWSGFFSYERLHLGRPQFRKQIIYDKTTNKVDIIVAESSEMLVYIEGEPEQYYETGTQIDDQLYYPAYQCIRDPIYLYLCKSYRWSIYQCELDDSACKRLPFDYRGDYIFGTTTIEKNDATNEIDLYLDIGDNPGTRTLIFSWGEYPRCYVQGCEIPGK